MPALRTKQVSTAAELRDWQAAWHSGDATPDVFRPALLDDPSVLILAVDDGEHLAGGVVLHRTSEVVGLSNVFTLDSSNAPAVCHQRSPPLPTTSPPILSWVTSARTISH
jgi:hypothetical protein